MKIVTKNLVVVGVLALIPGIFAQTQSGPHRDLTVWVSSQTGTHLGSGYTSAYLTNIHARTLGQESAKLRNAIDSLDGLAWSVQIQKIRGW